MKQIKTINYFFQVLPLYLYIFFTKFLPFNKRVIIGGYLLKYFILNNNNLKKRIIRNLEIAFPNFNEEEKINFINEFSFNAGKTFTEFFYNKEYQKMTSKFKFNNEGLIPILNAKKNNKPIFIVSGHYGPWESIRAILKEKNLETGAVYKKNNNTFYEKFHLNAIKRGGEPIFPIGLDGTRKMLKYLKKGGIVAIMIDQAVSDGEKFPFFDRPAKTSTSIAKIAIKLNALIVPAFALRKKDNSVEITFERPITISNVNQITLELNKLLEKVIKKDPVHWYWLHRRWKD